MDAARGDAGMRPGGLCAVLCVALAIVSPLPATAERARDGPPTAPFEGPARTAHDVALRAYVWGMPLVQAARQRLVRTGAMPQPAGPAPGVPAAPIDSFAHASQLVDPQWRTGVGPNHDTLYSLAWIDGAAGPFVLETPDFGKRYYTFQFGLADSSTEVSPGRRTHGRRLPPLFVHGPDYTGPVPRGMLRVRLATRYALIAGRFLVDGPADIPAVRRLQQQIRLRRHADWQAGRDGPPSPVPQRLFPNVPEGEGDLAFLHQLGSVLQDWAVPPAERGLIADFARIGLTARGFDSSAFDAATRAEIRRGLADGAAAVRARSLSLGSNVNGWTINRRGARFGTDYLLRAGVAKDQIFVNLPEEALYPVGRIDSAGRPLDGRHAYRIVFPKGKLPPVGAFWSITLYDDDGFMVPNAIQRYAIGDRTPGLVRRADGALELRLQARAPEGPLGANWLPAPAAPFYLMMRLYIPGKAALDGRWQPPAIERIEG